MSDPPQPDSNDAYNPASPEQQFELGRQARLRNMLSGTTNFPPFHVQMPQNFVAPSSMSTNSLSTSNRYEEFLRATAAHHALMLGMPMPVDATMAIPRPPSAEHGNPQHEEAQNGRASTSPEDNTESVAAPVGPWTYEEQFKQVHVLIHHRYYLSLLIVRRVSVSPMLLEKYP